MNEHNESLADKISRISDEVEKNTKRDDIGFIFQNDRKHIVPEIGMKLKAIHIHVDFDGDSEICRKHSKNNAWYVVEEGNFGIWRTEEEINKYYVLYKS